MALAVGSGSGGSGSSSDTSTGCAATSSTRLSEVGASGMGMSLVCSSTQVLTSKVLPTSGRVTTNVLSVNSALALSSLTEGLGATLILLQSTSASSPQVLDSTSTNKLLHGLGWQGSGVVVHSTLVNSLVNRYSDMLCLGRNSLLLNHRLNVLVNMVVDALPGDSWGHRLRVRGAGSTCGILVLRRILLKALGIFSGVAMLNSLVLDGKHLVSVLLRAANGVSTVYQGHWGKAKLTEPPCQG